MNALFRLPEPSAFQHTVDVVFAHDEEFFTINLDGIAGVLTENYGIANFHRQCAGFAIFEDTTITNCENFAL